MSKQSDVSTDLETLKAYEEYPYASYLPTRRYNVVYKRHLTLGHAKLAISGNPEARIYKFDYATGVWEEIPVR